MPPTPLSPTTSTTTNTTDNNNDDADNVKLENEKLQAQVTRLTDIMEKMSTKFDQFKTDSEAKNTKLQEEIDGMKIEIGSIKIKNSSLDKENAKLNTRVEKLLEEGSASKAAFEKAEEEYRATIEDLLERNNGLAVQVEALKKKPGMKTSSKVLIGLALIALVVVSGGGAGALALSYGVSTGVAATVGIVVGAAVAGAEFVILKDGLYSEEK